MELVCRGIVIRYPLIVGVSVGVCELRMSNVQLPRLRTGRQCPMVQIHVNAIITPP